MERTSAAYIEDIAFSYFLSYSFQRTAAHQAFRDLFALASAKGMLTPEERQEYKRLDEVTANRHAERIIDTQGNISQTARLVSKIYRSESAGQALIEGLRTTVQEEALWMCLPVYRDAILFYNEQDELIEGINICFECDSIESIYGRPVSTDIKTFDRLRQLLLLLGHPIETRS
ncbi:hypothetical protein [Taibaiella koreensis]|uniref:hypothetical protein n=1 Tax=Taibaiella koreensis TaxID=1268548 RepID=UPI000E5A0023|nr:hypothetical protein [Taibaiella koreensis]